MDNDKPEEFTEDVIKRYLDAEVYLQRGMTREAYIQLCKDKWDSFKIDRATEEKIIIDFLMPPLLDDHIGPKESFDYFESYEDAGYDKEGRTDVECFAKRNVVFEVENGKGFEGFRIREELTDEIKTPDFFEIEETLNEGVFFVALFDILGFSKLVEKVGSKGVIDAYQKLINLAILSKSYKSYERIKIAPNKYVMGTVYVPIKHAYFSDTIILWTKIETENFYALSPFVTKCADLICEALNLGIPLRGSLSFGAGTMHKPTNTYIGSPLIAANKLEKRQKWIGASFCDSFMIPELLEALNENVVVPAFCNHLKNDLEEAIPYLTVDWVSRWKSKNYRDLGNVLGEMMISAPEKNKEYYQNTIDFINFTDTQDKTRRRQFLRSKYYRCNDAIKFDSRNCHMATAIIRAKNGQFFDGAIIGFSPEVHKGLKEFFDNNIVFIRLAELENARNYFKERANERLDITQQFAYHNAINKADILYIDIVAYNAVEKQKPRPRKKKRKKH
jgi:hypothetical protein